MQKRIEKCKNIIQNYQVDAVLITSAANRFYLSGFTGSAGKLLITKDNENYLITDFRYKKQAAEEAGDFEVVEINKNRERNLAEFIKDKNINSLGFEDEDMSYKDFHKLKNLCQNIAFVPLENSVNKLRLIKEPEEINKIKKAIEIAEKGFTEILNFIEPGVKEKEIAAELEYILRKNGGEGPSFDFIVASGERSALPHGVASEKKLEKGEFVTIDFGTYYNGYCSDMTRTIILGNSEPRQEEIYNLVLKAHNKVIEKVKPGMTGKEADSIARELIADAGYEDNFGHGLGHGLGIEVHEGPKLSYQSGEKELKDGMVFTDEPGIYLPDYGGVRIEDDILLTENGCQVLNQISKKLMII